MNAIIDFTMHVALHYLMPVVIVVGGLLSLLGGILAVRFCYYFYLVHGKILWGIKDDHPRECKLVTKKYGIKFYVGISDAFIVVGLVMIIGTLAALIWPATLILLIVLSPIMLYPIFFQERHKKIKFQMKLDGTDKGK